VRPKHPNNIHQAIARSGRTHIFTMEALTAVGLASNILQFLDFCRKVLSDSYQIYHSANGTTNEYTWLEETYQTINQLSHGLSSSRPQPDSSTFPPEPGPSEMELQLHILASKCEKVSGQMLQELRGSRLESCGPRSKLASFQQSIQNAIWGRSRIKELQKTVDQCRKDLILCLQAITR
jgi:hypothetical protein